ncbi:MAG: hypothetical protein JW944_05455, partial [Deltaproteobacteria bacterium]|nr:hypothetical protein [Deltaproteobacteria bacterium]
MSSVKRRLFVIVFISGLFLFLSAQETVTLDISGTVTDVGNNPIEGATITLLGYDVSANTDTNGYYLLNSQIMSVGSQYVRQSAMKPVLKGGGLYFGISGNGQTVRINLYNTAGRRVREIVNTSLDCGNYRVNPFSEAMSPQIYLLQVKIGDKASLLKLPVVNGKFSPRYSLEKIGGSAAPVLGKSAQAGDTLLASADRFTSEKRAIDSFSGTQDFTLQSEGPVRGVLDITYNLIAMEDPTPSYCTAVWLEDSDTNYMATFSVTRWLSFEGYDFEMEICPDWRDKADWGEATQDEIDAVTMATTPLGIKTLSVTLDPYAL